MTENEKCMLTALGAIVALAVFFAVMMY